MEKAIVILNGKNEGKTVFVEHAKSNGYWVWNINYRNVLTMLAHKVGWDGKRDKSYYDFIDGLAALSNKNFDSENKYVFDMIEKFLSSDKANLLVVHGCSIDIVKAILEKNTNAYTINIATSDEKVDANNRYCKALNCNSESYKDDILNTLNIITKELKEN